MIQDGPLSRLVWTGPCLACLRHGFCQSLLNEERVEKLTLPGPWHWTVKDWPKGAKGTVGAAQRWGVNHFEI